MNTFTVFFLLALTASFAIEFWLARRHRDHVLAHQGQVPEPFQDTITLEAHQKAADYTLAKLKIIDVNRILSTALLLLFTLGGGIDAIDQFWSRFDLGPIAHGVALILSVFFLMALFELPLQIYQTFVIEERFGFNRTTPAQFIKDLALQTALSLAIGAPLLALVLWVMESTGNLWWLLAWAILMAFSLLMSWAYPTLIAPLFNKFDPLDDQNLKDRIQRLLERCGFHSKGIFVMDGSRRSGHGNAYFTGLGNNKRIVFFDTLVEALEPEELEAVLAHELGHYKRKHVIKMLITSAVLSLIGFALLGWLAQQPWFYEGLGVSRPSNATALLLFMLAMPVFSTFLQPLMAAIQRKYEFEADEFAASMCDANALTRALVKLYRDNAATLTPDPLYSAFHYSHPPAAIRIEHLKQVQQSA
ncbi:MAG: peptidase M48 [Methylothermaceae bacteria B42]|nr:MAG: peptidase M48 [Methylothermaceae bacteria B42]HHJ37840.1 M48 family peptidase [Methylothermaceae bacterium]